MTVTRLDQISCLFAVHREEMIGVAACGVFLLIFDAVLGSALWVGLLLLEPPGCRGLAGVWACAAIKWVFLHVFTSVLTEGKPEPVLRRLGGLLCLLPPVLESGCFLKAPPSEPHPGPSPNLTVLLVGPVASSLACLIWEKGLCGNGKGKEGSGQLDTRGLLMRTLKHFRPDTLYLIAAFGFLILGVICKYEIFLFHSVFDLAPGY